jgi:coenzyme PQQ precursor peptide PqqA
MKPYVKSRKIDSREHFMWEKPSYEIISAGAEITAYIHKR